MKDIDEQVKKTVLNNYKMGRYLTKYLFKYMYFYIIFIYALFYFVKIDNSIVNRISYYFSSLFPVIDIYLNKYGQVEVANMYSLFVLGLIFFTCKLLSKDFILFMPLLGGAWEKVKAIAFKIFATALFMTLVFVCFSDILVSSQFNCMDTYRVSKICMGIQGSPLQYSFHHLFLMAIITLFWFLAILCLLAALVSKEALKKYPNEMIN